MDTLPPVAAPNVDLAHALVEFAPDGFVVVDGSGSILLVNGQMEQLFGYGRDELLGSSIDVLVPERLRAVHRAHRSRYGTEPRTRAMGSGTVLFGRRKDGAEFPVEISLSPLSANDGLRVVAIIRDVTERVEADAEARAVREIVDATRDGLLIFDADTLRFSYVNQGAVDQVGYRRDELLQMTMLDIAPEFTLEQLRQLLAPMERGETSSTTFTTVHRRRDGTDVPVEVLLQAIRDADGRPEAYVKITRDIRDRLVAEDHLRQVERELGMLEDRERIARDLHDLVIQRLFAAGMSLQAAQARSQQDDVTTRIRTVVEDLDDTIRELRSVIFGLQADLQASGLRTQILRTVAEGTRTLGFEPHVRLDGLIDTIDDTIANELVATLREALSNVARHAGASSVDVILACDSDIRLRVVDNGIGIPGEVTVGNGIANLTERAERLGGHCRVAAAPGGGTVLEWEVPNPPA